MFHIIFVSSLWGTHGMMSTSRYYPSTKPKPSQTNNRKQRTITLAVSSYTLIQLACIYTEMCEKILPNTSHAQYNCFKEITEVLKNVEVCFPSIYKTEKASNKILTPLKSF